MKNFPRNSSTLLAAAVGLSVFFGLAHIAPADDIAAKPYKILATTQIPAAGRIDYVTADSVNRRVYVACGNAVSVFDLDTYKLAGTLAKASGHGVAIDPENHTGLVSGNPAKRRVPYMALLRLNLSHWCSLPTQSRGHGAQKASDLSLIHI